MSTANFSRMNYNLPMICGKPFGELVREYLMEDHDADEVEELLEDSDGSEYWMLAQDEYDRAQEIAGNCRVWNYYTDDSGRLDVWLVVYGYNRFTGFVEAQMYLSDLWSLSADNRDEIRSHMCVNKFTKNERR